MARTIITIATIATWGLAITIIAVGFTETRQLWATSIKPKRSWGLSSVLDIFPGREISGALRPIFLDLGGALFASLLWRTIESTFVADLRILANWSTSANWISAGIGAFLAALLLKSHRGEHGCHG
jgi:hypothetical protein